MIYENLKNLFFRLDPELVHHEVLHIASLAPFIGKLMSADTFDRLELKVGSTNWKSPVGLAAGLDKDASALPFFANQGFGALECGTVTLKAQEGNPKPRVFRYPEAESLRNAMGFPNAGFEIIKKNLSTQKPSSLPTGINLGKNKETSAEDSIQELSNLIQNLHSVGDYFVINVSSPNTPGLRALQEKSYLNELFTELNKYRKGKDLYLKLAPDLAHEKIIEIKKLCEEKNLTGIIATNTTIKPELGIGGVSGKLLTLKAREIHELILKEPSPLEFIAVGGISSASDLFHLWKLGGKASQIYTAYIYQGPNVLKNMYEKIFHFLNIQGFYYLDEFFSLTLEERKKRIEAYELSFN